MLLSVKERLLLQSVLPAQGSLTTIRIIHDMRQKLSFTEQEHKDFELNDLGNGLVEWNDQTAIEANFDLGDKGADIIREALRALDKSGKVTRDHISLFDKFLPE